MRKHRKALSLITSILVGIISFTGPVYAEGEDSGTATIQATPGEQVYDTNHGDESDPANDVSIKYTFDDQQAEVAIVAWHQSNSVKGEESAKNATVMKLPGGTDVSLTLQNFYSGSKRGNLIVVVKAKPGYLITGLNSVGSANAFYAITANNDGTIKPITDLQQSYTGINEAEQKAYNNSPDSGKYQILFNYFQTATSTSRPTDFEIITDPADATVSTTSNVTDKVKIGDTITLTSTITPKEIKTDKGAVVGSLSISSLDENTLIETVNGKSVKFSNEFLKKNPDNGIWTRIVDYTVQPEDVSFGKINYSISAAFHYDYTLNVKNGIVTTSADAEAKDSAVIDILSNEIQIKGESSTVVYDGKPHSESGAMINDLFPLNSDGSADITVNGVNYHVSGIIITSAAGTNAGNYTSTFDTSKAVVTSLNNDGQPVDVTINFTFETEPGSLTITPASLSISNIDPLYYNGQYQKLTAVVTGNIDGSPELVDGQDYDLSYSATDNDYKNAGTTVTVTATGKGNYTGTVSTSYKILPRPLRIGTNSNSKIYDGKPLTAAGSIDGAVASDNLRLITTGSQTEVGSSQNTYRIDYGNAKAGNYYVAVESIGTLTVYAPAPKPNGRTCQQDGYAAGYAWDDAQQACVLRVIETSPSIKNVPGTGTY